MDFSGNATIANIAPNSDQTTITTKYDKLTESINCHSGVCISHICLTTDQDNFHALADETVLYSLLQLAFSQSQLAFLTYN